MTASSGYRTLATVLELSSGLDIDVRTVQTEADGDGLVARVELVFPDDVEGVGRQEALERLTGTVGERVKGREEPVAESADAEVVDDGTRDVEEPTAATDSGRSPPEPGERSEPAVRTRRRRPVLEGWDDGDETTETAGETDQPRETDSGADGEDGDRAKEGEPTVEDADDEADEDDTETFYPCEISDCERTFGTEHGMRIHVGRVHRSTTDEEVSAEEPDGGVEGDDESEADGAAEEARAELEAEAETETETENETDDDASPDVVEGLELDLFSDVGVEVPDGIDSGDLERALESSSTLREVATHLGLDREEARGLLSELGLLGMVHGRVATADHRQRERSREEIRARLRQHATDA